MPTRDVLLALGVAVIWGANFTVIDLGLDGVPPLLFVALRFVVVLLPAVFLVKRPDVPWRTLAGIGLFLCAGQFGLLYLALALGMPAGLASLVLQAQVIFTVMLAAAGLKERPGTRQLAGIALGALGLIVVATGRSEHTPALGLLLCLAGALSWACGNIISRRSGSTSGLGITVWSAWFVPGPLLALSLLVDGPAQVGAALAGFSAANVLSTAYSAVLASLVGYGIWNSLLSRHPAASVAPFTLLVPVVGMTVAWAVQGERPGPAELAGGLILLLGVAVTVVRRPQRRRDDPAQPTQVRADGRATSRSGSIAEPQTSQVP